MNEKLEFIAAEQDYCDSQERAGMPVPRLALTVMCQLLASIFHGGPLEGGGSVRVIAGG